METLSQLKVFRRLKKKTVFTIFNIITEKRFTVGHKTRWELANDITEKFMSVNHLRDKVSSSLSSYEIMMTLPLMTSYWKIQFNWDLFVCPKTGKITTSLGKRRRKSLVPTTNSEDERLQKDIEQLNFIQNYQNDHLEEENRYFVGYGTKWIIRKVMSERRKSR